MPRTGHVNIAIPASLAELIDKYIAEHEKDLKLRYGRVGRSTIARIAIIEFLKKEGIPIQVVDEP